MSVPLVDLGWQRDQVEDEVREGWAQVLAGTSFVQGPAVASFEAAFARFSGLPHCIGVANGTDALEIALRAVGVRPGDRVAVPANTFIATAFAVLRAGARPVLVDVDPETLLMDPARLDARACQAVVPVHLFGQLAPMPALLDAAGGRPVVEDGAQAQGALLDGRGMGSWGAAVATSFYPGKNLGAYGDGGAVLSRDEGLARTMRLMANHGSEVRYEHETVGFNSRLDALQAVVLEAKLRRLAEWNQLRREAAARYDAMLAGAEQVQLLATAPGNEHVWHLYPVRVPGRDAVVSQLQAAGIGAAVHYPRALHEQTALAFLGHRRGDFPVAEQAAATMVSLPLFPGITVDQQARVVDELLSALR